MTGKSSPRRVQAVHPKWSGTLILHEDGKLEHENSTSDGNYTLTESLLFVNWRKYPQEIFVNFRGVYIHESLVDVSADFMKVRLARLFGQNFAIGQISVTLPIEREEVFLRVGTSDIPTFRQVFVAREYDSPNLPPSADVIFDLGANIGLSSVFFASRYPSAKLLCVEPDDGNYSLLGRNTLPFGDRVIRRKAAVWHVDGKVSFATEDEHGNSFGAWGGQVKSEGGTHLVDAVSIASLIRDYKIEKIDILKVDIEGSEKEIFEGDVSWLSRVGLVIVETHDRFRKGSHSAVLNAMAENFEHLPGKGENLYFRRRGW